MAYDFLNPFKIFFLFIRLNLLLLKQYFYFLMLFSILNPMVMISFRELLLRHKPVFIEILQSTFVEYTSLEIYFAPINPIYSSMFAGLPFNNSLKGYKNSSNFFTRLKAMTSHGPITTLNFDIKTSIVTGNININSLTFQNMTNSKFAVQSIDFSSSFFKSYGLAIHFSKDLKSIYLAHLFVMKCALYSMHPKDKMRDLYFTSLPNSLYYDIIWPSMQLYFLYVIFGCVIFHIKQVRRQSKESIVPQEGVTSIFNYASVLIIYNLLVIPVNGLVSVILCTKYFKCRFITQMSWISFFKMLLMNSNSMILLAFMICDFDMKTYNILYFCGVIMAPQVLFIFTFSQDSGNDCYFKLLTCMSPLFTTGLCLVTVEGRESNTRTFQVKYPLNEDCFTLKIASFIQVLHMIICIAIIIYRSFFSGISNVRYFLAIRLESHRKHIYKAGKALAKEHRQRYISAHIAAAVDGDKRKNIMEKPSQQKNNEKAKSKGAEDVGKEKNSTVEEITKEKKKSNINVIRSVDEQAKDKKASNMDGATLIEDNEKKMSKGAEEGAKLHNPFSVEKKKSVINAVNSSDEQAKGKNASNMDFDRSAEICQNLLNQSNLDADVQAGEEIKQGETLKESIGKSTEEVNKTAKDTSINKARLSDGKKNKTKLFEDWSKETKNTEADQAEATDGVGIGTSPEGGTNEKVVLGIDQAQEMEKTKQEQKRSSTRMSISKEDGMKVKKHSGSGKKERNLSLVESLKGDKESKTKKIPQKAYIVYVRKVYKSFEYEGKMKPVINGVSIKFYRNKVTTILGPNGSGKSTLLKLISWVQWPTAGNIYINGINLVENSTKALSFIQKYIEDVEILHFLSVLDYFGVVIHKNCHNNYNILYKRMLQFVELCQLTNYMSVELKLCPYWVIKIIKIICSFLTDRPVILLDDPLEGLDYVSMQNVCALFASQKESKTIIFTSCDSNVVEYCTDSVVVLIHGKKVSQTYIEDFNIETMVYRLIFSMEQGSSDYTVTRFIKSQFPLIKHEETIGKLVYFSIPKMSLSELWKLLDSVELSCERLGIWKYKINPICMRHFLSYSYDKYMKKKSRQNILFSNDPILPEDIKETSVIYQRQVTLILFQRIIYYCRYPNRLIMRFLIPIIVLFIWSGTILLSHPTVFVIDHGYFQVSYKEEINEDHKIYIGCQGDDASCTKLFKVTRPSINFIKDVIEIPIKGNFQDFQTFLHLQGKSQFITYNNLTLFALYFVIVDEVTVKGIVMANEYSNAIFASNIADNVLMHPKNVTIERYVRNDYEISVNFIDINFLLRLIIILLHAYSMTTYRYVAQRCHQQFYLIHKIAGIHYSVLLLPAYMIDLFLYWLIMCFMILILYLMKDHGLTVIKGSVTDVISIFFIFAMADSAMKLLIENITGYNPMFIFGFTCIDLFVILYLNVVYMINYVTKFQKYSYGGKDLEDEFLLVLELFFRIFFPSANLNEGLKSIELKIQTNVTGILFMQWVIYLLLIIYYHSPSYHLKMNLFSQKSIEIKMKKLKDPNSFLYVKNISLNKNHKLYYVNISNEFKKGTIWGILGRNDTGKTDLLNIILGISNPTIGGVYLFGEYVSYFIKKKGLNIGFCSEKLFYIPDLSVEETLVYWSRLKLLPEESLKDAVSEMLTVLLLVHEMNYYVKTLSKTSIKKLDIAIAILGYPEIIVLDDPMAGLDSISRIGVMKLLRKAKEQNSTVIISAKEVLDLRNILTHILVISNQRVFYQGGLANAIRASKLGYYLTIFRSLKVITEEQSEDLTMIIQHSFKDSVLFKIYDSHVVYFLPFQDINDPNTTKILIFMETIRVIYNYERYIIRYDVYHSPN